MNTACLGCGFHTVVDSEVILLAAELIGLLVFDIVPLFVCDICSCLLYIIFAVVDALPGAAEETTTVSNLPPGAPYPCACGRRKGAGLRAAGDGAGIAAGPAVGREEGPS